MSMNHKYLEYDMYPKANVHPTNREKTEYTTILSGGPSKKLSGGYHLTF